MIRALRFPGVSVLLSLVFLFCLVFGAMAIIPSGNVTIFLAKRHGALHTLRLNSNTFTAGNPQGTFVGNVSNTTVGSTVTFNSLSVAGSLQLVKISGIWQVQVGPSAPATAGTITFNLVETLKGASDSPRTSSGFSVIENSAGGVPVSTALPNILGVAQVGQTLSTNNGTWTNSPTSFTYSWGSAAPTPDITGFNTVGPITVSAGSYSIENAQQAWSLTNPDSQTLVFQVRPGDQWSADVGRPGAPNRSELDGFAQMFTPGTEVNISYNFDMTSSTARTDANGITIGQAHNNDTQLGGATSSPLELDLQPLDFMSIYIGNLTASPTPTGTVADFGTQVVNGVGIHYYQVYADPNPILRNHNYKMQIQFKYTVGGDNSGFFNVWRDGVQIVHSTGQLGFGFNVYWKYGIYGTVTNSTQIAQYQNMMVAPRPLVLGTGPTYPPVVADIGNAIALTVIANNGFGSSLPAVSAATGTVVAATSTIPVNTALPAISGTAQVGQVLTTTNGTWTNSPTSFTYQWNSAGANATGAGATTASYTPVAADIGNTLTASVTATNAGGSSSPATSAATLAVIDIIPTNSALPTISGTAQVGQTLTATTGTWTHNPTSFTYQWNRAGTAIGGATASTYVPVAADVGSTLTSSVVAHNTGGASAPATSAATVAVIAASSGVPVNSALPLVLGNAQVGQTLSTDNGMWTNSPTSYTYQWNTSGGGAATTTYLATYNATNTGNQGYQFREVIPAASLNASGTVSGFIRVGFSFTAGTAAGTMTAYVGEAAATGNPYNFDGSQVQLKFGGATTLTGLNGASEVFSDYVPFTLDATKNLVIAMFYGGTTMNLGQVAGQTTTIYYSNTAGQLDPSVTAPTLFGTQAGDSIAAGEVDFKTGAAGPIAGATSSTYVPVTADLGNTLTVSVIASNLSGPSAVATSRPTFAISAASGNVPVNSALPTISGTAQVGQTLTASNGTWTNSPTSYAYQWNSSGIGSTPVFSVSGGKVRLNGTVWHGQGIDVLDQQVSGVLALPNGAALANQILTQMPGINLVRIANYQMGTPASYAAFVNVMTAANVVVVFEAHNVNGSNTVNTGAALTTETNWYASLATYYLNNPYVWFQTNNEPGVGDYLEMQATYNAIRGTGNNTIIFFEAGASAGGDPSTLGSTTFTNTMHNVGWDKHGYDNDSGFSTSVATITSTMNNLIAAMQTVTSADGIMPVICLESGNSSDGINIDPGGAQVIQANFTNPNLVGVSAWLWDEYYAGQTAPNNLTNSGGLSLSSPYGLQVAGFVGNGSSTFPSGSAGGAITGATASTYVPASGDVGNTLTVSVIASNGIGPSAPAKSAATAAVTAASIACSTVPNGSNPTFDPNEPAHSGYELVFDSEFNDFNDFDLTCNAAPTNGGCVNPPGKNWYLDSWAYSPSSNTTNAATDLAITNGIISIHQSITLGNLAMTSMGPHSGASQGPAPWQQNWNGHVFTGGWYAEARMAQQYVDKTNNNVILNYQGIGHAAFWAYAEDHFVGATHFVEDDMIDGMQGSADGVHTYQTNIFDWSPPQIGTTATGTGCGFNAPTDQVNAVGCDSFPATVFNNTTAHVPTNFHIIGQLWVPATATTKGFLQNYLDGFPTSKFTWDLWANGPLPASGQQIGAIMDQDHMQVMLGADPPDGGDNPNYIATEYVDWVHVWQLPAAATASGNTNISPQANFTGGNGSCTAGNAATRTSSLTGTIGISGHVPAYADNSQTVSDAQYLGIGVWRDGISGNSPATLAIYQGLYNAGIRFIGLPWLPTDNTFPGNVNGAKQIVALGAGALLAVEGPNEPSISTFTYNGFNSATTWQGVSQWQNGWYTAVHADATLSAAGIPVTTPTLVGAEADNWGLQFLTTPTGTLAASGLKYADWYNSHVYPMFGGAAQTIDPVKGDYIQGQFSADFVSTFAHGFAGSTLAFVNSKPRTITEFGYMTVPAPSPGSTTVDTPTQGKDILNGIMNAWNEGFQAICIYTFYPFSGDGTEIFNGPGNPKASATYIHNFTTPLHDAGATAKTFTTGQLNYTLSGLPSTAISHLFQKSNNRFELVIWNNVTNWNFAAGTPITIGATNVTLTLASSATTLNVYDPTVQSTPITTSSGTTITAGLRDYPMIIEVIP